MCVVAVNHTYGELVGSIYTDSTCTITNGTDVIGTSTGLAPYSLYIDNYPDLNFIDAQGNGDDIGY